MQLLPRDTASILVLPSLLGGPQEGRWGGRPTAVTTEAQNASVPFSFSIH